MLYFCVFAAKPADSAKVVGDTSAAAMGVQPAYEHCGPVCAPTGSLGGGEDGSLPPDLRTGNHPFVFNRFPKKQQKHDY